MIRRFFTNLRRRNRRMYYAVTHNFENWGSE